MEPDPDYFTCAIFDRTFNSKRGLGVHSRSAHPEEYHLQNLPNPVKPRWTEAEAYLLASHEASILTNFPNIKIINQRLHELIPSRSFETIKGQRRKDTHKKAVQLNQMAVRSPPPPPPPPVCNSPSMPILQPALDDPIQDYDDPPILTHAFEAIEFDNLHDHDPADEPEWRDSLTDTVVEYRSQINLDSTLSYFDLITYILNLFLEKHQNPTHPIDHPTSNRMQR